MKLYHATFNVNLNSILEKGLIPNFTDNWDGLSSEQSGVYLTNDKEVAISFCEAVDECEAYELSETIVLLEVEVDKDFLAIDENNLYEEEPYCFIYNKTIKPENIKVVSFTEL